MSEFKLRIKPLEWVSSDVPECCGPGATSTNAGFYFRVRRLHEGAQWYIHGEANQRRFDSLEEAKEACREQYESEVMQNILLEPIVVLEPAMPDKKGAPEIRRGAGTRKIADEDKPCFHPEHDPPSHQVFAPGTYEHTCPACGRTIRFSVKGIYV